MTITPEQRQAIEEAGDEPVRVEDPETREGYILLRQEIYERLLKLLEVEHVDRSLYEFGEFHPDA
ncbi:hypothetical protein BH23PLA1_BH23PLA1_31430 [soil metagenome]